MVKGEGKKRSQAESGLQFFLSLLFLLLFLGICTREKRWFFLLVRVKLQSPPSSHPPPTKKKRSIFGKVDCWSFTHRKKSHESVSPLSLFHGEKKLTLDQQPPNKTFFLFLPPKKTSARPFPIQKLISMNVLYFLRGGIQSIKGESDYGGEEEVEGKDLSERERVNHASLHPSSCSDCSFNAKKIAGGEEQQRERERENEIPTKSTWPMNRCAQKTHFLIQKSEHTVLASLNVTTVLFS